MSIQAIGITEARNKLFELRKQIVTDHDQFILTHKEGNLVLMAADDWNELNETVRILHDKETLKALLEVLASKKPDYDEDIEGIFDDIEDAKKELESSDEEKSEK